MTAPTDNAALRAARNLWLRDLLRDRIQFTMYADATPEEAQEVIDSLSESDEYDPNVAALVQMPKWCSPCEAQEAVDRYFAAAIPPEQDGYAEAIGEGLRQWSIEYSGGIFTSGMKREIATVILRQPAFAALLAFSTDRHAEGRIAGLEEAAKRLDERAERARVAAIGGGMDPVDAELLDYEYSNAANELRTIANGGMAA